MAKSKNPVKKTPIEKSRPAATNATSPVRIIIEIVIRNETAAPDTVGTRKLSITQEVPDCPDNKFHYSFDRTNANILSLMVGGFSIENPPDSGDFTTCILDPNEPPSISVTVLGIVTGAGGRAALSLSLNGKDIYAPPRELDNRGGGKLGFTEFVKLPA